MLEIILGGLQISKLGSGALLAALVILSALAALIISLVSLSISRKAKDTGTSPPGAGSARAFSPAFPPGIRPEEIAAITAAVSCILDGEGQTGSRFIVRSIKRWGKR